MLVAARSSHASMPIAGRRARRGGEEQRGAEILARVIQAAVPVKLLERERKGGRSCGLLSRLRFFLPNSTLVPWYSTSRSVAGPRRWPTLGKGNAAVSLGCEPQQLPRVGRRRALPHAPSGVEPSARTGRVTARRSDCSRVARSRPLRREGARARLHRAEPPRRPFGPPHQPARAGGSRARLRPRVPSLRPPPHRAPVRAPARVPHRGCWREPWPPPRSLARCHGSALRRRASSRRRARGTRSRAPPTARPSSSAASASPTTAPRTRSSPTRGSSTCRTTAPSGSWRM